MASDDFFKKLAPQFARMGIWHTRFAPVQHRLLGASLQKMTASDEGYVCLAVFKPGDDRTAVILSLRRQDPGVLLTHNKPQPQLQPNSFIQIARKYLVGRRVVGAYASIEPSCFFMTFAPGLGKAQLEDQSEAPDSLILDLDTKPARVIIARTHLSVPERYRSCVSSAWSSDQSQSFFESYCEWSLDGTKTKRRATFEHPFVTYCCMKPQTDTSRVTENAGRRAFAGTQPANPFGVRKPQTPFVQGSEQQGQVQPSSSATEQAPSHEFGFAERQAFGQKDMSLSKALALLPVHVRRAVKTRMSFLERRLLKQLKDLPHESEVATLIKRAEGLRAHLYLWPEKSMTWYVPPDIMESTGLPSFLQLSSGQRPSDLLEAQFRQVERLRRRRTELLERLDESRKAIASFGDLVIEAGQAIWQATAALAPDGHFDLASMGLYFSRIRPAAADRLCRELSVTWQGSEAHPQRGSSQGTATGPGCKQDRHPYRAFRAATGEFIHVTRSATDGDAMLRLMPGHHAWLHVLVGEGSHVWLEKPKKSEPSTQALREAAILAIHHSRLSRGRQGEVRIATRADIEKKKDLPPGKVIVRRCRTILVKYEADELEAIFKRPLDKKPGGPAARAPEQQAAGQAHSARTDSLPSRSVDRDAGTQPEPTSDLDSGANQS